MAKVRIPGDHDAPERPWDRKAQADRYAQEATRTGGSLPMTYNDGSYGGGYADQVNAYAQHTPTLGAGGPHNRPARGHESET